MEKEWKKVMNKNNYVLEREGYYISYNPNTENHMGMTDIANMFSSMVGEGSFKDGEETAICVEPGNWYILEGDFRKDYEVCNSLEECLVVYNKHIDKRSNWSTDKIN